MPIESATYIGQLNAAWPLPTDPISEGDNHLQLIKGVLQSQFTSLGNAAVVRTAAELNAVTSKLTSFNGRATPAVVPTEGDYTLNLLGDTAITAPSIGQYLRYSGSGWVNLAGSLNMGDFIYEGYAGRVTDSLWFSSSPRILIPGSVVTIKNDGASGIGWRLTANAPCIINLTMTAGYSGGNSGSYWDLAIGKFISPATATAAMPAAGANRAGYARWVKATENPAWSLTVGAGIFLATGDSICLYWQSDNAISTNPARLTLSGSILSQAS